VMFRQICPGPCAFCTRCNQACDVLESLRTSDSEGLGALTPPQVAELLGELRPAHWTAKRREALLEALQLGGQESFTFAELVSWVFQAEDPKELARPLGLELDATAGALSYAADFKPVVHLTCGLLMVPHGTTASNVQRLFQNHSDGPKSQLSPEGISEVERGAAAFVEAYGPALRRRAEEAGGGRWAVYRSPLQRCEDTANIFVAALERAGIPLPEVTVDLDLIEINHGSWGEHTAESLRDEGRQEDAELAAKYRQGWMVAKATDGSGESLLEVIARVAAWLEKLQRRHGDSAAGPPTRVLVFGHGTFQNAVEALLRVYPDKTLGALFTRVTGGSHLRRGFAHELTPRSSDAP